MISDKEIKDDNFHQNSISKVILDQSKAPLEEFSFDDVDKIVRTTLITKDTECGIGYLQGQTLQKFANKKTFVIIYGISICMFTASAAYFNGTITTIEKRFKIPSKITGIVTIGNYIAQLLTSGVISYYANKGHKPRWMAVGIYIMVLYCCLSVLSHFIYGPGDDVLQLINEYSNDSSSITVDRNTTVQYRERKFLCLPNRQSMTQCEKSAGNFAPQVFLFIARFFYGIGDSIVFTLGISYMDDNVQKSKIPALISVSYFIKMLGPAIGYGLASFALKLFIKPNFTTIISSNDPRWLGAWWIGWILFAGIFLVTASVILLFPKVLPRATAERTLTLHETVRFVNNESNEPVASASWVDMIKTFKRLGKNGTLVCNNLAAVFFIFGYTPYWVFMPKYIETQFMQSASDSSMITGIITLIFSAFGFLISGIIISKFKPTARYLAAYNVLSSAVAVIGVLSYAWIGCTANENQLMIIKSYSASERTVTYNNRCNCDFVAYNPVCANTGQTFISACHAGCQNVVIAPNGSKIYIDCHYLDEKNKDSIYDMSNLNENYSTTTLKTPEILSTAMPGPCLVNCKEKLFLFLAIVCLLKVTSSAGTLPSFLVTLRCVSTDDKAVAMGFGLSILSLLAFIPAPIVFGYIFDMTCHVWGKTCTGTSNCWVYNSELLRYTLNFTSATFIIIGAFFHIGVWYCVKDVQIFDSNEDSSTITSE